MQTRTTLRTARLAVNILQRIAMKQYCCDGRPPGTLSTRWLVAPYIAPTVPLLKAINFLLVFAVVNKRLET